MREHVPVGTNEYDETQTYFVKNNPGDINVHSFKEEEV